MTDGANVQLKRNERNGLQLADLAHDGVGKKKASDHERGEEAWKIVVLRLGRGEHESCLSDLHIETKWV